jgi:hypothetical protein
MKLILSFLTTAWLAAAITPPTIASFTAAQPQATAGQSITLSWSVSGATSVKIDPGVGTVTGTSVKIAPKVTTKYTLTATNSSGSKTATLTVTIGAKPVISSFTADPPAIPTGQSSSLGWSVSGATSLKVDPVGAVTGTSLKVSPKTTTTYTLTATNAFGSATATALVMVGAAPTISGFTANPAKLAPGQQTTLSWTATGSPGLMLNPGIGPVTGTSYKVKPSTTTTYTLTATNTFGTAKATVAVPVGTPPVIKNFSANPNIEAGPGVSAILIWDTTGATSLSIDHGVGTVTGNTVKVSPSAPTTYTLTAGNAVGSVTATAAVRYRPLTKATSQLYYSEHAVFIIPPPGQVTWTGDNSWGSVFSTANVNSYVATLKSLFPQDFFFVVVTANNLSPNLTPRVQNYRHLADGIGSDSIKGVGVPDICFYNVGGGTVIDGAYGVLDHEIGHNWGVFMGLEVGNGHWKSNSTVHGQMADIYSDDGYTTVKQIDGDPDRGFTWAAADNLQKNETELFSSQDLYAMGLNPTWPDVYVLTSPAYNSDHTISYSAVARYDQAWVEERNGFRNPSYRTSDKKFRIGFVYVARDLNEVLAAYQPIERSIVHFTTAEQIDTKNFRFQVPFLVETQYRASLDALLADLDGNHTPTLTLGGAPDLVSSDGSATMPFTAADADGAAPTVACVPASSNCSISGKNVVLRGVSSGTHFITIKAQDAGGKKAFATFVVDVK